MLRIGLIWHSFYSSNLGINALTAASAAIIAEEAVAIGEPIEFVVFGPRGDYAFEVPPGLPPCRFVEVSQKALSPGNLLKLRRELRQCRLVFDIGSGDSFADIYGAKRFAKMAGLKFLVPAARARLILSPQTIGPFGSRPYAIAARRALALPRMVFARDELSRARAAALMRGSETRLALSTDVAFALPRLDAWPTSFPVLEDGLRHIGVNVSGLLYRGGYTGANQFGLASDYAALTDRMLSALASDQRNRVWLVPHVQGLTNQSIESDRSVSEDLAQRDARLSLSPLFRSATEAKTFIARLDHLVAARMHASIAAVSSGVACTPLSYSIKFQGLYESLGYRHVIDLKQASENDALAAILANIERSGELRTGADAARARAIDMLSGYRRFVRGALVDAAAGATP